MRFLANDGPEANWLESEVVISITRFDDAWNTSRWSHRVAIYGLDIRMPVVPDPNIGCHNNRDDCTINTCALGFDHPLHCYLAQPEGHGEQS